MLPLKREGKVFLSQGRVTMHSKCVWTQTLASHTVMSSLQHSCLQKWCNSETMWFMLSNYIVEKPKPSIGAIHKEFKWFLSQRKSHSVDVKNHVKISVLVSTTQWLTQLAKLRIPLRGGGGGTQQKTKISTREMNIKVEINTWKTIEMTELSVQLLEGKNPKHAPLCVLAWALTNVSALLSLNGRVASLSHGPSDNPGLPR